MVGLVKAVAVVLVTAVAVAAAGTLMLVIFALSSPIETKLL